MNKYKIIFIGIVHCFLAVSAFAQESEEKSKAEDFYWKMVMAPEWEFCSMYGRALQGELHLSNFDSWSDTAAKIIKEVAKERKIRVNVQRVMRKKLSVGDSKCHFFAHLGYAASKPIRINTTVVGKTTREQIVMNYDLYVYFDNDKFVGYQSQE